jgi:formylglycine-generating enzyme required for sulfatase activity
MKKLLTVVFVFLLLAGCGEEIPVPTFIACDACKKEVSSEGANCPDCGHPISKSIDAYRKAYVPQPESKSFIVPDLDLELIWVEPGKFEMGSPYEEKGRDEDETPHWVTLTAGYYLGKYEVTQAQWNRVMGDNPSSYDGVNLPVESVSWEDIASFCDKLTEFERKAGRLPLGMTFQLPTEAQWEYACRAGTMSRFALGDELTAKDAHFGLTVNGDTMEVGKFPANAWGFHGMHGNVEEWCADWYGDYETGSIKDPTGPASGSDRVIRGSSFRGSSDGSSSGSSSNTDALMASYARSANRDRYEPGRSNFALGFRLSLRPPASKPVAE